MIVVDASGSMSGHMSQAIKAVHKVVDTLTPYDYAAAVSFDDEATCDQQRLLQMTPKNAGALKEWASALHGGGGTDFEKGFDLAFDLLEAGHQQERTSSCNRVILFMSDVEADSPVELVRKRQSRLHCAVEQHATIFTYAFGAGADSGLLREVACENNGVHYDVPYSGDLGSVMADYFRYFASSITVDRIKWHSYHFASTGDLGMSGCLPAYDRSHETPRLLGVACADLNLFDDVEKLQLKPDWPVFAKKVQRDSEQCLLSTPSEQQLQHIRSWSHSQCSEVKRPPAGGAVAALLAILLG